MASNFAIFATIEGISTEGKFDEPHQIDQYIYFYNDSSRVIEEVADAVESIEVECGRVSLRKIQSSSALVMMPIPIASMDDARELLKKVRPDDLERAFRSRVAEFTEFLWIVKDCAASVGEIFFITGPVAMTRTVPNAFNTDCKGSTTAATFTQGEIRTALRLFRGCLSIIEAQEKGISESQKQTLHPSVFHADRSRISRAILMLQVVRQSEDMALKVANYCSCFEILFASEGAEGIAHQLAERMAFFLRTSANERIDIYKQVKMAYGVRSKIFHGSFLGGKRQETLESVSAQCDSLLREVFKRILEAPAVECANFFGDNAKQFNEYFEQLIFGLSSQE